MLELNREGQRGVHSLHRTIRIPHQPQGERGCRVARDSRIVPDACGPRPPRNAREQGDRLIEVVQSALEVDGGHQVGADQQVPVDQHPRVALAPTERQDVVSELGRPIELPTEHIQAGEAPKHRELLADIGAALEELHRAGEGVLDFLGDALGRHERSRQACLQGDLLADPLRRRSTRSKDGEHVAGQADRIEVPAAGVVEDHQRAGQLVELFEIGRCDPVGPGDTQVRDIGGHCRERGLALITGQRCTQAAGQVSKIAGVGSTRPCGEVGTLVEPVRRPRWQVPPPTRRRGPGPHARRP